MIIWAYEHINSCSYVWPRARTINEVGYTCAILGASITDFTFCCLLNTTWADCLQSESRWGSRRKVAAKAKGVQSPLATAVPCFCPSGKVIDLPPHPSQRAPEWDLQLRLGEVRPLRGHPCKGMRERPPNFWRASFDKVTGLHRPTVILSIGYDTDCVSLFLRGGRER